MVHWIQIVKLATVQIIEIIHSGIVFVKMVIMMIIIRMKNA